LLRGWPGAFFIRRSFKGDRIYSATMGAYVKRLLQDGFTQEFFIEGRTLRGLASLLAAEVRHAHAGGRRLAPPA